MNSQSITTPFPGTCAGLDLSQALAIRSAGLSVLPAIAGEKRPDLPGWKAYQKALPGEAQLREWFAAPRAACLVCGAVSGNLEMIDFDLAGERYPAWRELVASEAPDLLDRVVIERTPGGGKHIVYRVETPVPGNDKLAKRAFPAPDANEIEIGGKSFKPRKTTTGFEAVVTLIETRGEGGIFLCAPTPGYVLEQGEFTSLPTLTAAERELLINAARSLNEVWDAPRSGAATGAPSGLLRPGDDFNERGEVVPLLQKHGWTLVKPGDNSYWRRPGKTDGWSATLKDRVFYIFSTNAPPFEAERGYGPFAVYALLEHGGDFNRAATALRDEGYGASDPGDVNLSGFMAPPPGKPLAEDPGPVPESMMRIPGFVGEVMDYCLATAPYPNTVMAFCGALSLLAFLTGRKVRDPGDNRTNLYLLGLAHSAAGKDWPRKINMRVLHKLDLASTVGDRFASGEGIQDALFLTPCMLFQTDEIDGMLQMINKAKDARYENIMGTLLSLYTSSNSVFPMRRKAGTEAPGAIDQPCLVLFGTAIPQHYYEALSTRMLTNGFFARMIVLESGKRGTGQEAVVCDPPQRILETAAWWRDFQPSPGNLAGQHPVPATVPQTAEAREVLAAMRREAEAEYSKAEDKGDEVATTVWGRVSEQSRKLALLYAVSEAHTKPVIGQDAAEWATRFVAHQTRRMLFMASCHVADNPFHAECLKVIQKLHKATDHELSHSVLLKRMKTDSQSFRMIIETLLQQGEIVVNYHQTPGRTGTFYRLAGGESE